jgi:hypothetical protein
LMMSFSGGETLGDFRGLLFETSVSRADSRTSLECIWVGCKLPRRSIGNFLITK